MKRLVAAMDELIERIDSGKEADPKIVEAELDAAWEASGLPNALRLRHLRSEAMELRNDIINNDANKKD